MEYLRNCPECGKELSTKNKYYYKKACEKNTKCLSCIGKNKIFTLEHRLKLSKNHADFSKEKNPFYKKKHKQKIKNQISKTKKNRYKIDIDLIKRLSEGQKKYQQKNGNQFKGKKHSDETKILLRKKMIERLDKKYGKMWYPNYNKKETKYFNNIEKQFGYNGIYIGKNNKYKQYKIIELGYFVDFYDESKNIVIEYDEKRHYKDVYNNILKEKDIYRQNSIIKKLKCKFYRYNETINLLYEVFDDSEKNNKTKK